MTRTPHDTLTALEQRLSADCRTWDELDQRLADELDVSVVELAAFRQVSLALAARPLDRTDPPQVSGGLSPNGQRPAGPSGLLEQLIDEAARHYRAIQDAGDPHGLADSGCRVFASALALEAQLRNLGPRALVLAADLQQVQREEVAGLER